MLFTIKQRKRKFDKKRRNNVGLNESIKSGVLTKNYAKSVDSGKAVGVSGCPSTYYEEGDYKSSLLNS